MKKIFDIVDKFEKYAIFVLLLIMTILIFIQVVFRFVFHNSLTWTEELARYLLVWSTFIGASLGVKKGAHIGVEAFKLVLPPKAKRFVEYISIIFCLGFCGVVFKESIVILSKQLSTGQTSPAIGIPMWVPYLAITVGTFLMMFRFIEVFINLKQESLEGGTK